MSFTISLYLSQNKNIYVFILHKLMGGKPSKETPELLETDLFDYTVAMILYFNGCHNLISDLKVDHTMSRPMPFDPMAPLVEKYLTVIRHYEGSIRLKFNQYSSPEVYEVASDFFRAIRDAFTIGTKCYKGHEHWSSDSPEEPAGPDSMTEGQLAMFRKHKLNEARNLASSMWIGMCKNGSVWNIGLEKFAELAENYILCIEKILLRPESKDRDYIVRMLNESCNAASLLGKHLDFALLKLGNNPGSCTVEQNVN